MLPPGSPPWQPSDFSKVSDSLPPCPDGGVVRTCPSCCMMGVSGVRGFLGLGRGAGKVRGRRMRYNLSRECLCA